MTNIVGGDSCFIQGNVKNHFVIEVAEVFVFSAVT